MIWKKTAAVLASALLATSLPVSVFALEPNEEFGESALEQSSEAMFGEDLMGEGAADYYSSFLNSQENLSFGSELLFDVNSNLDSAEYLNYQYQELTKSMEENGYGNRAEISTPQLSMGYSSNIQQTFLESYGDVLANGMNQMGSYQLPDSFDTSTMLSQMEESRNSYAAQAKSSELFQTVRSQISIGNIFSAAQQGVSMPDLGGGSLQDRLGELSGSLGTGVDYSSLVSTQQQVNQNNYASGSQTLQSENDTAWNAICQEYESGLAATTDFAGLRQRRVDAVKGAVQENLDNLKNLNEWLGTNNSKGEEE